MLFVLTFIESFATILIERGLYFLTKDRLGFSDTLNLWLALVFGVCYVAGSLASHPIARRTRERRLLGATLIGQMLVCGWVAIAPAAGTVFAGAALLGLLYGLKWPLIESYTCANKTPREMARSVGSFSLSWSLAVPVALAAAGPLIAWDVRAMLLASGAASVASVGLLTRLPRAVTHLAHDHPERPSPEQAARLRSLLVGSRWALVFAYASMWILAALLPGVFERLAVPVIVATGLSALIDVARVGSFLSLRFWQGWHGRRTAVAAALVVLPIAFLMVVSEAGLAVVLVGEVLFGLAAGVAYYASLYYAMVAMNASVEAGGGHEGLIGAGFAIGPACGLLGVGLAPMLGSQLAGVFLGIAPLLVLAAFGASRALVRSPH